MSKICDRNYSNGSMLSIKVVAGVGFCPNCGNPAQCHGKSIDQRALMWALSDDTGISSKAIASHMSGGFITRMMPPSDADDRGRCIRLLELIPEWISRLPEMVKYDVQKQEGIVINNSGISAYSNSWAEQIPLIIREGNLNAASNGTTN